MMTSLGRSGLAFVLSFGVTGAAGGAGGRAIEITSPSDEERWCVDSGHYITWKSAAGVGSVKVEYSLDGGRSWTTAADRVPSSPNETNRLLWRVPAQVSSQCKVRIRSAEDASIQAETAAFHIIPSQEAGYRWVEVTVKAAFAGRDGAGALTLKGRMWLLGGWNPGDKVHFPKICNSEVMCGSSRERPSSPVPRRNKNYLTHALNKGAGSW